MTHSPPVGHGRLGRAATATTTTTETKRLGVTYLLVSPTFPSPPSLEH
jgi:hypothetical protein